MKCSYSTINEYVLYICTVHTYKQHLCMARTKLTEDASFENKVISMRTGLLEVSIGHRMYIRTCTIDSGLWFHSTVQPYGHCTKCPVETHYTSWYYTCLCASTQQPTQLSHGLRLSQCEEGSQQCKNILKSHTCTVQYVIHYTTESGRPFSIPQLCD